MVRRVMTSLCWSLFGLSVLGLHLLFCYRLLGGVATVVVVGVQVAVGAWIVYMRIRAPD